MIYQLWNFHIITLCSKAQNCTKLLHWDADANLTVGGGENRTPLLAIRNLPPQFAVVMTFWFVLSFMVEAERVVIHRNYCRSVVNNETFLTIRSTVPVRWTSRSHVFFMDIHGKITLISCCHARSAELSYLLAYSRIRIQKLLSASRNGHRTHFRLSGSNYIAGCKRLF